MQPNTGTMPPRAHGRRIHVILRSGYDTRRHAAEALGWPADGPRGCRWRLLGDRSDILEWEFVQ